MSYSRQIVCSYSGDQNLNKDRQVLHRQSPCCAIGVERVAVHFDETVTDMELNRLLLSKAIPDLFDHLANAKQHEGNDQE